MMTSMRRTALALLCLAPAALFAQSAALTKKLDEVFAPWNRTDAPGGVVGIVQDGKLIYAKGFGMASLELRAPMGVDSAVDIGSVSKQFAAMCILLLEEEGKLSLDDEIQKHLPEIPRYAKPITIRHLLLHTSGLRDYLTLLALTGWGFEDDITEKAAMDMIARQSGVNFEAGASWNYCNSGYFLVSQIIRRVSGLTIGRYARRAIFEPLGMTNTRFGEDRTEVIPGRVRSYRQDPFSVWRLQESLVQIAGDGGVVTTIGDFAKWDANFRQNRLGKGDQALIKRMETTTAPMGPGMRYALGLMIDSFRGVNRIQHGGDWLGFNAQYSRYPEKGVSVFSFGNDGTQLGKSLNDKAAAIVMNLPEPPAPTGATVVNLTPAQQAKFVGSWQLKGPAQMALTVSVTDGKLSFQAAGQPALPMQARSESKLFLETPPIELEFTKADANGLWIEGKGFQTLPNGAKVEFTLTRGESFKPSAELLAALAGVYYAPDLKTNYEFEVRSGRLMIFFNEAWTPVTVESEKQLSLGGITMAVERSADGKVAAVVLSAGRANGIRAVKIR